MTDLPHVDKVPAVATVMTPFPCTVSPDTPAARVRELMAEHGLSHVPVIDDRGLAGLARARDLDGAADDTPAIRLCTEKPYVVDLHESLGVVAREMVLRQTDTAVVLRAGRLAGIFTVTDACAVLARILGEEIAPPESDGVA